MLSNDMKIAVQKNHLGGQILSRSLNPSEKNFPKNQNRIFPAGKPNSGPNPSSFDMSLENIIFLNLTKFL